MKKDLLEVKFEELIGKTFDVLLITKMLCEICEKPLSLRQMIVKRISILSKEDFQNLLKRAAVHDCAEIDIDERRIYFYDHDFPGEAHKECIEKM